MFKTIINDNKWIVMSHSTTERVFSEYIIINKETGILEIADNLLIMIQRIKELGIVEGSDLDPKAPQNRSDEPPKALMMGGDY